MYNLGDISYKPQPKFMNLDTVDAILEKTRNFIEKYNKKSFIFHGGEQKNESELERFATQNLLSA